MKNAPHSVANNATKKFGDWLRKLKRTKDLVNFRKKMYGPIGGDDCLWGIKPRKTWQKITIKEKAANTNLPTTRNPKKIKETISVFPPGWGGGTPQPSSLTLSAGSRARERRVLVLVMAMLRARSALAADPCRSSGRAPHVSEGPTWSLRLLTLLRKYHFVTCLTALERGARLFCWCFVSKTRFVSVCM